MTWGAQRYRFPDPTKPIIDYLIDGDVPAVPTDPDPRTLPFVTVEVVGSRRRQKALQDVRIRTVSHAADRPGALAQAEDVAELLHALNGVHDGVAFYRTRDVSAAGTDGPLGATATEDQEFEEPTVELLFDVTIRGTAA